MRPTALFVAAITFAFMATSALSPTEAAAPLASHQPIYVGGIPAPACVSYAHHPTLRKTCRGCDACCKPDIIALLSVTDPACPTRCLEIPVCLPACCCDVPTCKSRCGVLGRRVVSYHWCCGYKVDVVFRRNGDVVVHSFGR